MLTLPPGMAVFKIQPWVMPPFLWPWHSAAVDAACGVGMRSRGDISMRRQCGWCIQRHLVCSQLACACCHMRPAERSLHPSPRISRGSNLHNVPKAMLGL